MNELRQENRKALIIASSCYEDEGMCQLQAPQEDATALARILEDAQIGGFKVKSMVNEPSYKVAQAIEQFFADSKRDDLLLIYFSGHGIKDDDGQLYFATCDTKRKLLRSTAVSAKFVNDIMRMSRSRRQVLLLDCCYSGAFARGLVAKADLDVHSKELLEGRGRVVLTASDSMQYSFEQDNGKGEGVRSLFSQMLINGLESGEADTDGDGFVSLDELYDYIQDRFIEEMPQQTPQKWAFDVQGEIIIAKNPKPVIKPAKLPAELLQAIASPFANIRVGAISELDHLLHGGHEGLALAAQLALMRLAEDDSRSISAAAAKSLGSYAVVKKISLEEVLDTTKSQSVVSEEDIDGENAYENAVLGGEKNKSRHIITQDIKTDTNAPEIVARFCAKCGMKLLAEAIFCQNCGASICKRGSSNFKICLRCASLVPLYGIFCGQCGYRFNSEDKY